jgi:hypothetical protein
LPKYLILNQPHRHLTLTIPSSEPTTGLFCGSIWVARTASSDPDCNPTQRPFERTGSQSLPPFECCSGRILLALPLASYCSRRANPSLGLDNTTVTHLVMRERVCTYVSACDRAARSNVQRSSKPSYTSKNKALRML